MFVYAVKDTERCMPGSSDTCSCYNSSLPTLPSGPPFMPFGKKYFSTIHTSNEYTYKFNTV